jgi:lysozyme
MRWCWCLLDENTGNLLTGWQQVEGKWYYLNPNGTMLTGWLQDKNKWYYLLEESNASQGQYKGEMVSGCTMTIKDKEYSFDSSGAWIESLVSDALIDFIKSFEGYSPTHYLDEVGVDTLGYGMTGEEIEGISEVTEEQATQMLKDWIEKKYAPVIKDDLDSKGIKLNQNEFDALVSMAYNVGTGGVLGSTLYKNICAGIRDSDTITANFQAWSNAGGKRLEGLYRRRTKEANIFLYGDYTGNN